MKNTIFHSLIWSVSATLLVLSAAAEVHSQPKGGQEVCTSQPSGKDTFSVGEIRTSLLLQEPFQKLNGAEWVLMNGDPLMVQTELSLLLAEEGKSEKGKYGLKIPDARGRFLRMANNSACADHRNNEEAYKECIVNHDPDGDRVLGDYQKDDSLRHAHKYNDIFWSEHNGKVDIYSNRKGDAGTSARMDYDNHGFGWDRTTEGTGGNETRPKNIAVNYYIKICNCRTEKCK